MEIWLDHTIRIRVRLITDNRGNVDRFTVQLEIWLEEQWSPVVRYDNAHEEAHIDYVNPKGVTYQKEWLGLRWPFNSAFTQTREELEEDYQNHIARFITQLEGN